jgi:hypothetical protein
MATVLVFAALVAVCRSPAPLSQPGLLTAANQVTKLTPSEAAHEYRVRLRGVVTYYDPLGKVLFVQDHSGGVSVDPGDHRWSIGPGDGIDLTGVTAPMPQGVGVKVDDIRRVGASRLPHPKSARGGDLSSATLETLWVRARASVLGARIRDGLLRLNTRVDGTRVEVCILNFDAAAVHRLADADIRVDGVAARRVTDGTATALLHVPSIDMLTVEHHRRSQAGPRKLLTRIAEVRGA